MKVVTRIPSFLDGSMIGSWKVMEHFYQDCKLEQWSRMRKRVVGFKNGNFTIKTFCSSKAEKRNEPFPVGVILNF